MKIENIWNELKSEDEFANGILRKRYSANSSTDAYACIRLPERTEGIAFRFKPEIEIDLSIFQGNRDIHAELIEDDSSGDVLLVLTLIDRELTEIFSIVSENLFDFVAAISDQREVLKRLNDRFIQWNSLFARSRDTALSQEAQLGLYGELWFLKKMLNVSNRTLDIVDSWMGPEGGIRDFEYNSWAVEVKSTRTHNPQRFFVSSERQLDDSLVEDLFLFHFSVDSKHGSDASLNSLVDELIQLLEKNPSAQVHFHNKLLNVGYYTRHRDQYDSISYSLRKESFYRVMSDFPRIKESDLMDGVGDVGYSVILGSIQGSLETTVESVMSKIPET